MTAEEFAWWTVMLDLEWLGPQRQARLLAHIACGVRNGPVQGPEGKDSLWQITHFINPERWAPPAPVSKGPSLKGIKAWFARFGF